MTQLGSQVYDTQDFGHYNSSFPLPDDGSLIGAGIEKTYIELTSVAKTAFPPLVFPAGSPYAVSRVQPVHGPRLSKPVIRDLTIMILVPLPMPAHAWFGGLRLAYADNLLIQNVRVIGVPGSGNRPPDETFGISLVHCKGGLLDQVEVDGKSVGAAGVGLNSSSDIELRAGRSHHSGHSHGYTAWQCQRITYNGCTAYSNGGTGSGHVGVGFNHEDTDDIKHMGSSAYGNTMGSHRYYSSGPSRKAKLVGCYGDNLIVVQGTQAQADVDITEANMLAGIAKI